MPADGEMIGQFTKRMHPDFDGGLIPEPGNAARDFGGGTATPLFSNPSRSK